MSKLSLVFGVLCFVSTAGGARGQDDTTTRVTFGAFVDVYYAYDFDRPPTIDRSFAGGATFTTQPTRSNEFNVNLAYVEANLRGRRVHGRLAFQVGTSVQANYSAEPMIGSVSGPLLSRQLQEAYAGYQVARSLWIDGGIFYSNMGMESWASKDNPTYTRSLVAEYSPYYSSGVRAVWQAVPVLAIRLDVVNGWQNISETNSDKGVGLRLDYTATSSVTFSYYNFVNGERLGRTRVFNGIGVKAILGRTVLLGQVDMGTLNASAKDDSTARWWGATVIASHQIARAVALVGRVETYDDEDQVNIVTGLSDPYRGPAASLGIDVTPEPGVMWRTEVRGFFANDRIFPNGSSGSRRGDGFVVSALTLAF